MTTASTYVEPATAARAKAKIVCTIGPSTNSVEILVHLIRAGMAVARLNFSHGTSEDHRAALNNLRRAGEQTGRQVTVLQDLQGLFGGGDRIDADLATFFEMGTGKVNEFTVVMDEKYCYHPVIFTPFAAAPMKYQEIIG